MAQVSAIELTDGTKRGIRAGAIPYGIVDSTSTATAFTATVPGVTELTDGTCVLLKNGVITSAADFTINVNGLGAKHAYSNMAAETAETTIFNINYTMLFVYDSTRASGGGWICYRGYNSNDNTIGYQIRTNSMALPVKTACYRYRILFESMDGTYYIPANSSTSTNATAKRTPTTEKINPFGRIVYYSSTTALSANGSPGTATQWVQYVFSLGYSFNYTGAALTLTTKKPVWLKTTPQSDGSVIIDATTPFTQTLPSTEDGKVYIWLGVAYSATNIEMTLEHPVVCYKDGLIRCWPVPPTKVSELTNDAGYLTSYTETDPTVPAWAKASSKPTYTASEVGAVPTTRTVNGKALSADISLTASDVSALPSSTTIPSKTSDLTNDSGFITSADIPIELYPVHVSLSSSMSSGTADHTSLEILAAISAGKLPVVGVAMGNTVMMATLVHVGPDLDGQYTEAIFVYENQNAWFYNYITLSIDESGSVTLVARDAYATLDDIPQNVSDLTNDSNFIPRTEFRLTKSENQGTVTYTVNARPVDIGDAANNSYPVFTELVNNSKTQYWTLWFVNISSNKFGLYRYENDDKSIRYVVFEYGGYGNVTTGTEGIIDLDAPMSHPVGTVIITDSNTNPSTTYGGAWALIDKEFTTTTAQQITCGTASSSDCVINSTNTTSMSAWVSRQGHSIFLSINAITFKVSVSGTNLTLGTFDLAKLGTSEAAISPVIMAWSDGAHAIVGMNINRTSGVLQSQDVVVRGTGTSIAAGSSAVFTVELPCDYTCMVDSFCNKFYWRRTA